MEKRSTKKTAKGATPRKTKAISFRRQFDTNYTGCVGEENKKPSMTVPDMSLTVHQLLENHTRGIHSDIIHYDPQYFESEIPNYADITEKIEHKNQLKEDYKLLEAQIQKEKQALINAHVQKQREEARENENGPETPPKTPEKGDKSKTDGTA